MEITQHHGKVDRISDLPDHVLLHILSFLSTPSAVATCILSKRWMDIWTRIKTLDLTNCSKRLKSHQHHISFRNFLDKILLSKDFSPLELVKLDLFEGIDCVHAIEWVTLLMKRGVKQLELRNDDSNEEISLSASFYASNELVKLRLRGNIHVCFPGSLHFPLLKDVHLYDICFLDGSSVKNLLSGCLILESLSIMHCNGEGNMDLYSCSLKDLHIDHIFWSYDVISVSAPNLEDLCVEGLTCSSVISAPKLRNLSLTIYGNLNCSFGKMPSLVHSSISIERNRKKLVEIFHIVSGLESLWLSYFTIMTLEDNNQGLPVLPNLKHLGISVCSWHSVVHILELSPNLKYLVAEFDNVDEDERPVWFCPLHVPDCLSVLEKFEIKCYDGDIFIVKMMLYILMNAKSLKEIIVKVSSECEQSIEEIIEILEMAPSASDDFGIIVC